MINEDEMGFWQVSDKVPASVITTATAKCEREDCCLSARISMTTLAGTSDYYDKSGQLHIDDGNRLTATLFCRTCWKSWKVNNNGEILDYKEPPAGV